jgi:hypothetical protein
MSQKKLHLIIAELLRQSGKSLRIKEIIDLISKDRLYVRPKDGKLPDYNQVWGRIANYPRLFTRNDGIVSLQPQSDNEHRMFRLTWNTKGWEVPVKHDWRTDVQGDSSIAFENQYGFGGEEWLFNARYQIDGYQYGYIRGAKDLPTNVEYVDRAYLFTIHQESSERYFVGIIDYLEIIRNGTPEEALADDLYNKYLDIFRE